MIIGQGRKHGAVLLALGVVMATGAARAADFTFTTTSEEEIDWHDPLNWVSLTPGALPGINDDVTIAPGLLRGAEVFDTRTVNSVVLDSGINVYEGGSLTVKSGITANAGYFINSGKVTADVVNRTYIANTGSFVGDVTNMAEGAVINDGDGADGRTGRWTGNITSNAGFIVNSFGIWTGDVAANTGIIVNANGGIWTGDINNSADLESTASIWNGNLVNSGVAIMSGELNGDLTNSGVVWMPGTLAGVGTIINTGRLGLEDATADDTLSASSWSGKGTLTVDFDPSARRSDKVVLSGDYSADTVIEFRLIESGAARVLGNVPIIVVGGDNRGTVVADGLPSDDGAIVYALRRSGNDWVVAATPGAAVSDVAGAWAHEIASLGHSTRLALSRRDACAPGADLGAFHGDASGLRLNIDLACAPVGEHATLGIGVTLGFGAGDNSARKFADIYGELIAGAFRALLDGQMGATQYRVTDPVLGSVSLDGFSGDIGGSASYALALGSVTLAPEAGLRLRSEIARSPAFGNAGAIRLTAGPAVSAHAGVTVSAALPLDAATLLTPFASVSLKGDVLAPGVVFTDSAGTNVTLPVTSRAPHATLALGVDLVRTEGIEAGLRADLDVEPGALRKTMGGNVRVPF